MILLKENKGRQESNFSNINLGEHIITSNINTMRLFRSTNLSSWQQEGFT